MIKIILLVLLWILLSMAYMIIGAGVAYVLRTDNAITSLIAIYIWPIIVPCVLIVRLYRKVFG